MSNAYYKKALTGGTATSLDNIDGDILSDDDVALVFYDDIGYFYKLDATSGASEDSPDVISPDSNAGTKRWILQDMGKDISITIESVSSDTLRSEFIPAGYVVTGFLFEETSGNEVKISVGSSDNAIDIVENLTISANGLSSMYCFEFFSKTSATDLDFNDAGSGDAWNGGSLDITVLMKRIV